MPKADVRILSLDALGTSTARYLLIRITMQINISEAATLFQTQLTTCHKQIGDLSKPDRRQRPKMMKYTAQGTGCLATTADQIELRDVPGYIPGVRVSWVRSARPNPSRFLAFIPIQPAA